MKKHELDDQSIIALVEYRLERSINALSEAEVLFKNSFYNAAVNRLYYACYYSVSALLINNRISAQTHKGVKQMFGLYFIKKEKVLPKYGRFYNQMFNIRETGDYDDFIFFDKETLEKLFPQANEFIQVVKQLI